MLQLLAPHSAVDSPPGASSTSGNMRSHLPILLFSSMALSALGQTFENFPAVGGSRPSAPLRSSSPQSRPPGSRVNVQNTRVNEVEPQQEERRVNRNKGRSRSRGKAPAPTRTAAPSRASASSRGASAVRDSAPSRTAAPTRIALRPRPAVPAAQVIYVFMIVYFPQRPLSLRTRGVTYQGDGLKR